MAGAHLWATGSVSGRPTSFDETFHFGVGPAGSSGGRSSSGSFETLPEVLYLTGGTTVRQSLFVFADGVYDRYSRGEGGSFPRTVYSHRKDTY